MCFQINLIADTDTIMICFESHGTTYFPRREENMTFLFTKNIYRNIFGMIRLVLSMYQQTFSTSNDRIFVDPISSTVALNNLRQSANNIIILGI